MDKAVNTAMSIGMINCINILQPELGSAKAFEFKSLDESFVVNRCPSHWTAKLKGPSNVYEDIHTNPTICIFVPTRAQNYVWSYPLKFQYVTPTICMIVSVRIVANYVHGGTHSRA